MLSQIREAAEHVVSFLQAKVNLTGDQYIELTTAEVKGYFEEAKMPFSITEINGGWYVDEQLVLQPVMSKEYVSRNAYTLAPIAEDVFELQQKRMLVSAWVALAMQVERAGWNVKHEGTLIFGALSNGRTTHRLSSVMQAMEILATTEVNKASLRHGLLMTNRRIKELENKLQSKSTTKTGLSLLLERKPSFDNTGIANIMDEVEAAFHKLPTNGLACRTWGFEVEIADAKGVNAPFGIDKGEDGSLRSYESCSDCDCSCDECYYHECDCEHCETGSSDPEHCNGSSCSSADSAEFRTQKGINRVQHAGLHMLCTELEEEDAEVNDTCGVHIHVYAQDLQTKQVAHLLAIYKWLENFMAAIAGRDDVNYAKRIPVEYIQTAYNNKLPVDKPRAVNLTHIAGDRTLDYIRGTIEFRQMLGNYDAKLITVWAWMVRGLVEVCKRGARLNDFLGVASFNDYVTVLAKFDYRLEDEKAGLLIPGGQQDNKYIKRYTHERA